MSSLFAPITGATAAIAELPQIALPQAIRQARCDGKPRQRAMAKEIARVTTTVPTTAKSRTGPEAMIAARLIEAPSSITATSSSCLAEKAMPDRQNGSGVQAARIPIPIRIAMTSAST